MSLVPIGESTYFPCRPERSERRRFPEDAPEANLRPVSLKGRYSQYQIVRISRNVGLFSSSMQIHDNGFFRSGRWRK